MLRLLKLATGKVMETYMSVLQSNAYRRACKEKEKRDLPLLLISLSTEAELCCDDQGRPRGQPQ